MTGPRQGQTEEDNRKACQVLGNILDGSEHIVMAGKYFGERYCVNQKHGGYDTNGCLGRALIDLLSESKKLQKKLHIILPDRFIKGKSPDQMFYDYLESLDYFSSDMEIGIVIFPNRM